MCTRCDSDSAGAASAQHSCAPAGRSLVRQSPPDRGRDEKVGIVGHVLGHQREIPARAKLTVRQPTTAEDRKKDFAAMKRAEGAAVCALVVKPIVAMESDVNVLYHTTNQCQINPFVVE